MDQLNPEIAKPIGIDRATGRQTLRARTFVFHDEKSQQLLRRIEQLAPSFATVLVLGETGTGKEVVARHIHDLSERNTRPFVAVNCGALAESLIESELFGHERGAFTGASSTKIGWFEAAQGGTLFLDEVAELSLSTQVKLLRVIQESEIVRLGSREPRSVDVRLIAATNVPLQQSVAAGRFRADLFYRLNVAQIALPPLRQRRGDIIPLAEHYVEIYARRLQLANFSLAPDTVQALMRYAWPGNIRELENVIHRALLVCTDGRIGANDLFLPDLATNESDAPFWPAADTQPYSATIPAPTPSHEEQFAHALQKLFEAGIENLYDYVEEQMIRGAHEFCGGNQVQTARVLGLSRNIVRSRLIRYGEIAGSARRSTLPPQD
jgi:sigma-54-specific transcriptional regulator